MLRVPCENVAVISGTQHHLCSQQDAGPAVPAATQTHMDTQRCTLSTPPNILFFISHWHRSDTRGHRREAHWVCSAWGWPAGLVVDHAGIRKWEEKVQISQQATQLCSAGSLFPCCNVENLYSSLARIQYKLFEQGHETLPCPTFDNLQKKRSQQQMMAAVFRSS